MYGGEQDADACHTVRAIAPESVLDKGQSYFHTSSRAANITPSGPAAVEDRYPAINIDVLGTESQYSVPKRQTAVPFHSV